MEYKDKPTLGSALTFNEELVYRPTEVERRVDGDTSVYNTLVKQEDPEAVPVVIQQRGRDLGINTEESVSRVQENTETGARHSEVAKTLFDVEDSVVATTGQDFAGRSLTDEKVGGAYSKALAQAWLNEGHVDERYGQHPDRGVARVLSALNPQRASQYEYNLLSLEDAQKYSAMKQEVRSMANAALGGEVPKEELHSVLTQVLADPDKLADAEYSFRLYKDFDGDIEAAKAAYEEEKDLPVRISGMSAVEYRKAPPPTKWEKTKAAFRNDNFATMAFNWVEDKLAQSMEGQTQNLGDDVLTVGIDDPQARAAILTRRDEVGDAAAAKLRERYMQREQDESILDDLSISETIAYRGAATLLSPEMLVGGLAYKPVMLAAKGAGKIGQHMVAGSAIAGIETAINESAKLLDETRDYTMKDVAMTTGLAVVGGGLLGGAIGKYAVSKQMKNLQKQRQLQRSAIRAKKHAVNATKPKSVEELLASHATQDIKITTARAEVNTAAKLAGSVVGSSRYSVMADSKNPVTRMIGQLFMEDPVGTGGRVASTGSAALRATTISEGVRVIPAGVYKTALDQFLKRKGSVWASRWASTQQSGLVNDGVREFNETLIKHINAKRLGKQSNAPMEIQAYADSIETMNKELTDRAQRAGIFRKGGHTANDIKTELKGANIKAAIEKSGRQDVTNRLVRAILDGDSKITETDMAVAQAEAVLDYTLGVTTKRPVGYSNHLDVDGIMDLIDTEVQEIIGRTVSRKSGDIAMSEVSHGVFKNNSSLKAAINAVDDPAEKQLIEDAIAMVRGQAIKGGGVGNSTADVRDAIILNRMGGLATDAVGEAGQTFTRLAQQLISNPTTFFKALGMAVGKGEGKKLMKQTQQLTRLMDNMMDLERMSVRIEDNATLAGIDKKASALGWATNKLTGGKLRPVAGRALGTAGGYNAISSFLRRANTASLMQDMARHFTQGKGVMSLERMKGGGIVDDAGQNALLSDMFKNVVQYNRDGSIKDLMVDKWSPEALDQLQIIFKKDNMLNQQRLLAGELAPWQDKTMAKVASLFHESTLAATRKQTASNLAYADGEAAIRVLLNQMTSMLAMGTRAGLAGTGAALAVGELPEMESPELGKVIERNSVLGYVPTGIALGRELYDQVAQGNYTGAGEHILGQVQVADFLTQFGDGVLKTLTEDEREEGIDQLFQMKMLHTMVWMELVTDYIAGKQ